MNDSGKFLFLSIGILGVWHSIKQNQNKEKYWVITSIS